MWTRLHCSRECKMVQPFCKPEAFSHKIKHTLTIWPSNSTTRNWPEKNENVYLSQNLYAHIYSHFIHNHPKLEATQMSFNWWTNKLWYIHAVKQYWYPLQHGCNSNVLFLMKEASLKRLREYFRVRELSSTWLWWWLHNSMHLSKLTDLHNKKDFIGVCK